MADVLAKEAEEKPNISRSTQHLTHLAVKRNTHRLAHFPVELDNGHIDRTIANAILNGIHQLNKSFDRMNDRFDRMDERFERIETRLQAAKQNSVARLQNSLVSSSTASLTPLHDPETNTPIDKFPATPADIPRMSIVVLNSVLRTLGVGISGSVEARRQRLSLKIGLKAESTIFDGDTVHLIKDWDYDGPG